MAKAMRVLLICTLMLCTACFGGKSSKKNAQDEDDLPRATPSYVHWMESQSLLRMTPELAAIVSGSSLAWNSPSATSDYATLLQRAGVWFMFSPLHMLYDDSEPALAALAGSAYLRALSRLGVGGIYLSAVAESGLTYGNESSFNQLGRDLVRFDIASAYGGEEAYLYLENASHGQGMVLGGDVLPAATGLGPDFALALRGVRDYPGLYMMVEIPPEFWEMLPVVPQGAGSQGQVLGQETVFQLASHGVIPPAFSRDRVRDLPPGGWAVTTEIVGVDGLERRWLYRYSGSPVRPVLNWDDPSGTARRVLSASIIQQIGLLHQPLAGLSIEALWGQDPAPIYDAYFLPSPEPALSALRDMSRELRRYGAWSLLLDELPLRYLPEIQATEVDFSWDSITSPYLEFALLTGDTGPWSQAVDEALAMEVEQARLWRQTPEGEGINFATSSLSAEEVLTRFLADGEESGTRQAWMPYLTAANNRLHASAATLAAIAVGLTPDEAMRVSTQQDDKRQRIEDVHLLQLAFRAMQPGLFMLSGRDLEGSLFSRSPSGLPSSLVAWRLTDSARTVTRQGMPAPRGAYPTNLWQSSTEGEFGDRLGQLLALREKTGVALGQAAGRAHMSRSSAMGLLTRLPDGDYLLCAGNFSGADFTTDVTLPAGLVAAAPGLDLMSENSVAVTRDKLQLRMQPWQYRLILLKGRS